MAKVHVRHVWKHLSRGGFARGIVYFASFFSGPLLRERIQREPTVHRAGGRRRGLVEELRPRLFFSGGGRLALLFGGRHGDGVEIFYGQRCDLVVWETGLGDGWMATNIW